MNYFSIDIETTGLNPAFDQILEFAAILDDFEAPVAKLPSFQRTIKRDTFRGNAFALSMNHELLRLISESYIGGDPISERNSAGCCEEGQLLYQFAAWVEHHYPTLGKTLKVAGHNAAGFDVQFLKRLPGYDEVIRFHHRVLDVGSIWFEPGDHELPATQKCLTRAGFGSNNVLEHRAYPDAMNAIKLIRRKYDLPV